MRGLREEQLCCRMRCCWWGMVEATSRYHKLRVDESERGDASDGRAVDAVPPAEEALHLCLLPAIILAGRGARVSSRPEAADDVVDAQAVLVVGVRDVVLELEDGGSLRTHGRGGGADGIAQSTVGRRASWPRRDVKPEAVILRARGDVAGDDVVRIGDPKGGGRLIRVEHREAGLGEHAEVVGDDILGLHLQSNGARS